MENMLARMVAFTLIVISLVACNSEKKEVKEVKEVKRYLPFNKNTPCIDAIKGAKPIKSLEDIKNIPIFEISMPEKGEYETTEAFKKRLPVEIQKEKERIEKEKIASGYYGFVKVIEEYIGINSKYDADKGTLTLWPFDTIYRDRKLYSKDKRKFDWTNLIYKHDKYQMLDFGAYGTLRERGDIWFRTEMVDFHKKPGDAVTLKMSVEEAKELRSKNINFVMVGKLVPPYQTYLSRTDIDAAGKILYVKRHIVPMEVTCAAIFKSSSYGTEPGTGEIVYEYK